MEEELIKIREEYAKDNKNIIMSSQKNIFFDNEKVEVQNSLADIGRISEKDNFNEYNISEKHFKKSKQDKYSNEDKINMNYNEQKNDSPINKFVEIRTIMAHQEKVSIFIQLETGELASGSYDNTIKIWDIENESKNDPKKIIKEKGHILYLLEFEKNKILSGTDNNTINLWDLNTECETYEHSFEGHELWINCLVKIDNQRFASASNDALIIIWDYYNRSIISMLEGHEDCILSLILLKNGKLCSGSSDETIKIWDINNNICVQTLIGHEKWVKCVLELDNCYILSGSDDQTIKIWSFNDEENSYILNKTLTGHTQSVRTLCQFDENTLISGSFDCTIKVWDINTWNCIETLREHESIIIWVINIKYKGEKILASCSDDKSIKLWKRNNDHDDKYIDNEKKILMS